MGNASQRKLAQNPELRAMYELYRECVQHQLVVFKKPVGDGKKEKLVVVEWPVGFATLPDEGGWNNQSYLVTRLLSAALRGDKQGCSRLMNKG